MQLIISQCVSAASGISSTLQGVIFLYFIPNPAPLLSISILKMVRGAIFKLGPSLVVSQECSCRFYCLLNILITQYNDKFCSLISPLLSFFCFFDRSQCIYSKNMLFLFPEFLQAKHNSIMPNCSLTPAVMTTTLSTSI